MGHVMSEDSPVSQEKISSGSTPSSRGVGMIQGEEGEHQDQVAPLPLDMEIDEAPPGWAL